MQEIMTSLPQITLEEESIYFLNLISSLSLQNVIKPLNVYIYDNKARENLQPKVLLNLFCKCSNKVFMTEINVFIVVFIVVCYYILL